MGKRSGWKFIVHPFEIPTGDGLTGRLDGVLQTLAIQRRVQSLRRRALDPGRTLSRSNPPSRALSRSTQPVIVPAYTRCWH